MKTIELFANDIETVKDEMRYHDNLVELATGSIDTDDVYYFHFGEDLMEEIRLTGNKEFANAFMPNGILDDALMMEAFGDLFRELHESAKFLDTAGNFLEAVPVGGSMPIIIKGGKVMRLWENGCNSMVEIEDTCYKRRIVDAVDLAKAIASFMECGKI